MTKPTPEQIFESKRGTDPNFEHVFKFWDELNPEHRLCHGVIDRSDKVRGPYSLAVAALCLKTLRFEIATCTGASERAIEVATDALNFWVFHKGSKVVDALQSPPHRDWLTLASRYDSKKYGDQQ